MTALPFVNMNVAMGCGATDRSSGTALALSVVLLIIIASIIGLQRVSHASKGNERAGGRTRDVGDLDADLPRQIAAEWSEVLEQAKKCIGGSQNKIAEVFSSVARDAEAVSLMLEKCLTDVARITESLSSTRAPQTSKRTAGWGSPTRDTEGSESHGSVGWGLPSEGVAESSKPPKPKPTGRPRAYILQWKAERLADEAKPPEAGFPGRVAEGKAKQPDVRLPGEYPEFVFQAPTQGSPKAEYPVAWGPGRRDAGSGKFTDTESVAADAIVTKLNAAVIMYNSFREAFRYRYKPRQVRITNNAAAQASGAAIKSGERPRFEESDTGIFLLVEANPESYLFPHPHVKDSHEPQMRACFNVEIQFGERDFWITRLSYPAVCRSIDGGWELEKNGRLLIEVGTAKK